MTTTVVQLINDSLREIHVLQEAETATADMIQDSKRRFLDMLGFWSIDGLKIPYLAIETFALVNNKSVYTWGIAGDFNSVAPNSANAISSVSWVFANVPRPLRPMSVQSLLGVPYPSELSSPNAYFFDLQAIPKIRLDVFPIGGSLVIASHKPLDVDLELTDDLTFPPAYNLPLTTNLACFLAAQYDKEIGPALSATASRTRKAIEKLNIQPIAQMQSDVPGAQGKTRTDYAPLTSPW